MRPAQEKKGKQRNTSAAEFVAEPQESQESQNDPEGACKPSLTFFLAEAHEPQEPQESQNDPERARKPSLAFLLMGLLMLLIATLVVSCFLWPVCKDNLNFWFRAFTSF